MPISKRFSLFLILSAAFIDFMGVGLVYPMFSSMLLQKDSLFLPFDTPDSTRGIYLGILLSTMPCIQFFSSPILGSLSDRYGRKGILIVSLILAVVGYAIACCAIYTSHLPLLFLSRIIIGIAAGSGSVVGACIADLSLPEEKARAFGLFNMATGLGFAVGPFLGGKLSDSTLWSAAGYDKPFLFAAIVSALNMIFLARFFTETFIPKKEGPLSLSIGLKNIRCALGLKQLRSIFLCCFVMAFGWSFYWEFIPTTWISEWGLSSAAVGNFYAYGATFYAISCGVLISPIVKRYRPESILFWGLLSAGISIGILLVFRTETAFWVFIPLQQYSVSLLFPTCSAIVSNHASEDNQGEILGILHSVESSSFAIAPLVAGPLLSLSGKMPIWMGCISMFCAGAILAPSLNKKLFLNKLVTPLKSTDTNH